MNKPVKFLGTLVAGATVLSTSVTPLFAQNLSSAVMQNKFDGVKILKDTQTVGIVQSEDENFIVKATYNKETGLTDLQITNKLTRSVTNINGLTEEEVRGHVTNTIGAMVGGAVGFGVATVTTPFVGPYGGAALGGGAGYISGVATAGALDAVVSFFKP